MKKNNALLNFVRECALFSLFLGITQAILQIISAHSLCDEKKDESEKYFF
jgi:hypothetical protein